MLNTAHIAETAVLILAAFLIGCVVGYMARRLLAPGKVAASVPKVEAASVAGAPLVTAPTIAPVAGARPRSAAERLAAAAGREEAAEVTPESTRATSPADARPATTLPPAGEARGAIMEMMGAEPPPAASAAPSSAGAAPVPSESQPEASAPPAIEPARVAGEAISVAGTAAATRPEAAPDEPDAPAVVVDRDIGPVKADDVPPIDEKAHVVEPVAAAPHAVSPDAPAEESGQATAAEASAVPKVADDTESAAMRAIEGGWTPPTAPASRRRPVPHPEHTTAEADAAVANARSAVAAARAAADAAIAGAGGVAAPEPPPQSGPQAPVAGVDTGLSFEGTRESAPDNFLDGPEPRDDAQDEALDFETASAPHGFGRPPALTEPRGGSKDNLKQIKGVTPHLEQSLNALGIYHFDQIASWDQKAVVWVDGHLGLRGRIVREKWIDQARALSGGHNPTLRPVRR